MKKILLGLVAVSVASFAAPNYNNPTTGTTVWETGQVGKIGVTGTVTTTPDIIKYVIFASTDAGVSDIQDSLVLHPFVFTQEEGTSIFKELNPKVYVKRVNESNDGFVDLEPTDAISFKIVRVTGFVETGNNVVISNDDWFKAGTTVEMLATALLENSTLQNKIAGISDVKVSPDGLVCKETSNRWLAYKSANNIAFKHTDNGVLEITTMPRTLLANYDSFSGADLNKLNEAFAGNNTGSAISIEVKI